MVSLWVYADDTDATTYCVWDSWNSKLSYKIPAKTWTKIVFDISNAKGTYQFMSLTAEDSHANLKFIVDDIQTICNNFDEVSLNGAQFDQTIWTTEGFAHHQFWEHQRKLAKRVLNDLDKIQL